jgi:GTP-binding protein HflX
VKAFRSTLEEVIESDLLVHVVDVSNENFRKQMEVTTETIEELGAGDIPEIILYNKVDLIDKAEDMNGIFASAKSGLGIDLLVNEVKKELFKDYITCKMLIPYEKGDILSYFMDSTQVLSISHVNEGTIIQLECKQSDYSKYNEYVI